MNNNELEIFFKTLLIRRNMTQTELCAMLNGISRSYLCQLINGNRAFTTEIVAEISTKLHLTESEKTEFYRLAQVMKISVKDVSKMLNNIKGNVLSFVENLNTDRKSKDDIKKYVNDLNVI